MQFFIDECISPQVAARLNETGRHAAVHPRDIGRRGDPDHLVLRNAIAEDRIIVTENARDFRGLVGREELHPGLFILPCVSREQCLQLLMTAIGYAPQTQRGARVHAVRQAKVMFIEMRERLELARDAWAEAREEGHGHVSAGLAALRAVAGRQVKELDPDEIRQRLERIAGRDLGADEPVHDAGADTIRDRLRQVLGRDKPDPRQEQQRKLEIEREKQRQLDLERQRERDRDLGWEL